MTKQKKPAKLIPVHSLADVPDNLSDDEAAAFWDSHEVTEAYLQSSKLISDDDLPPVRHPKSRQVSIRLNRDLDQRLQKLARLKGTPYQSLLKTFVAERLYEEEKRLGLFE